MPQNKEQVAPKELIDILRAENTALNLGLDIPDNIPFSDAQMLIEVVSGKTRAKEEQKKKEPSAGMKALGALTDIGTGTARAGIASAALGIPLMLAGKENPVKPEDIGKAMLGQGPSTTEYYDRTGLPQGPAMSEILSGMYSPTGDEWLKFKKGGIADPTVAHAITNTLDFLLPNKLAIAGMRKLPGVSTPSMVAKSIVAGELPNDLLNLASKKGYGLALRDLDKGNVILKGRKSILPEMYEKGIWGTDAGVLRGIKKWEDELQLTMTTIEDKVKNLVREAAKRGEQVHPSNLDEVLKPAYDKVREGLASQSPETRRLAKEAEKYLNNIYTPGSYQPGITVKGSTDAGPYAGVGGPSGTTPDVTYPGSHVGGERTSDIDELMDLGRKEQNLGSKAYEEKGVPTPLTQQQHADIGNAVRPHVEEFMTSKKALDLGLSMDDLNRYAQAKDLIGRLLNTNKAATSQAMRGSAQPAFFAGASPYAYLRGALPTSLLTGGAQLGRQLSILGVPSAVNRFSLLQNRDEFNGGVK